MQTKEPRPKTCRLKHVGFAAALAALIGVAVCGLWQLGDRRSADERLADINATRAIPDSQNAAIIYTELLQDPRVLSVIDSRPDFLKGKLFCKRRDEPWRRQDDPKVAAWIAKSTPVLDRLVAASRLDACRFPVSIELVMDEATMDRGSAMRQWTTLLQFAISNDLGERRMDNAVTKWRCLIQIGNHLRQQPYLLDHMTAYGSIVALEAMARFVVEDNPPPELLREIEAMPLPLADDWQQHVRQIRLIDRLVIRKMKESFSLRDRLRYPITSYRMKRAMNKAFNQQESPDETTGRHYRQNIATARGLRILIALRRCWDQTDHWPENLDEVAVSLPEPILTDPLNGRPFVYRRTEDAFELYSRGRNGIDDTAQRGFDNGDDWPIWPLPQPKSRPKPEPAERNRKR